MGTLQLKRLSTVNRLLMIPALSEPIWDLNQKILYIGDGVTYGGIQTGNNNEQEEIVNDEILSGTINGLNKVFTTLNNFLEESIKIHVNGLQQRKTIDFTVTGNNQITLSEAPSTIGFVDYLTASYLKG